MNQSQEREYNAHEACIAQTTTLFEVKLRIRIRSLYTTGGVLEREGAVARQRRDHNHIIRAAIHPPTTHPALDSHLGRTTDRPTSRSTVATLRSGDTEQRRGQESSPVVVVVTVLVVVVGVQAAQRQNGWWGAKAELTVQQWRGDVQLCMCCCRVGERCDIVLFAVA